MTRHFIIGDHLVAPQPEGDHHGIFVGHDQVIHCLPPPAGEHSGQLALTSLAEFSQHGVIEVKPHAMRLFSREECLTRAYARLSEGPALCQWRAICYLVHRRACASPQVTADRSCNRRGCRSGSPYAGESGHQCNGWACCQHAGNDSWRWWCRRHRGVGYRNCFGPAVSSTCRRRHRSLWRQQTVGLAQRLSHVPLWTRGVSPLALNSMRKRYGHSL